MLKICLTVPVRGTPSNITRYYNALDDTNYGGDVLFGFDEDDPCLDDLISLSRPGDFVVGTRKRFVGTLNHLAEMVWDDYDVITMKGIDHLPRTFNFDRIVSDTLRDNYMCWGRDGFQDAGMATCAFVRTNIIKSVGFFINPQQTHLYCEQYLESILGPAGLDKMIYRPDMYIEHMHPYAGKAELDEQYKELNSNEMYSHDRKEYEIWVNSGKAADTVKLLQSKGF